MSIIAFDSHKRYTFARVEDENGRDARESRIEHRRGSIAHFLSQHESGSAVAVETIGNWYWIIDEIEQAGMQPRLVHARKAKLMLGSINKTDKLDAKGLNKLQRVGTLPTVWIPPGDLRDKRELPRTRMVFGRERTRLKNRIHSVLDKYGLQDEFTEISDIFGRKGRQRLHCALAQLPSQSHYVTGLLLEQLDQTEQKINAIEARMKALFEQTDQVELLRTMPGVGFILAVVILQETGDIGRFGSAERFASYCGVTPRVHCSGGRVRYGRLRPDTNHYLKWAFSEAGNSVAVNHERFPSRHVSRLYKRIRHRKNHAKAIGAVGRHLAEATYWVLTKGEVYRERGLLEVSSTGA
ncbi:MAG: IS110 family transposase [Phycisphaerales bacterium]|nr:MAG: IS110 family transposase [Phycisphaerales bacterium]